MIRSLAALLALVAAPLAARAAEIDHPYKDAKVGDTVTYKSTTNSSDRDAGGTYTITVTAKTDKQVTIKTIVKMGGRDFPERESKVDLDKPFVPSAIGSRDGAEMKVEKLKEGEEKVQVGDKTYDATWTTYKVTAMLKSGERVAEVKVWTTKEVPLGEVKTEGAWKLGEKEVKFTTAFEKAEKKGK